MNTNNAIRVSDIDIPELEIYTKLNERQVRKVFEPQIGAFICESEKVIGRALEAGYEPLSFFCEESKLSEVLRLCAESVKTDKSVDYMAKKEGVSGKRGTISKFPSVNGAEQEEKPEGTEAGNPPIYVASYETMKGITGYSLTGGILSAMRRKPLQSAEELIQKSRNIVLLDDVENPTNVGAIFRSAAALGADGVLLTEGSADPLYRRAARVSMGSVFKIDWTFTDRSVIKVLKEREFQTMALALTDQAVALDKIELPSRQRKVVILGNEDHGISPEILKDCDHTVIIPMARGVDSLNVAAASAVAFYEIFE